MIPPEVSRYRSSNAHGGIYIGGIDLCRGHLLTGVDLNNFDHGILPDSLQYIGNIHLRDFLGFFGLDLLRQQNTADTHCAAEQAAQYNNENHHPGVLPRLLFLLGFRHIPILRTAYRYTGVVGIAIILICGSLMGRGLMRHIIGIFIFFHSSVSFVSM